MFLVRLHKPFRLADKTDTSRNAQLYVGLILQTAKARGLSGHNAVMHFKLSRAVPITFASLSYIEKPDYNAYNNY
jgi:hypothetical protein